MTRFPFLDPFHKQLYRLLGHGLGWYMPERLYFKLMRRFYSV